MSQVLTEEQLSFQLILHSGNARSKIMQALEAFKQGQMGDYEVLFAGAEEDLRQAHEFHFQMIQNEAQGNENKLSLLLIHAEDHLMSTLTMKDIVKGLLEIVQLKCV
ncbi:PTS lactose/cellobiose transporter subunit IIA [Brevibacillus migulae]|uniref:PTS lactose/cellobiose transporter subunit IIA n=1 Tax=Brevibacillus migulae TaxID=1644114 RepID=UPI00106DEDEA|nr:PTS lactose/cellobiose transporter subunit IIA [Brevibacillus migulae]